MSQFTFSDVQSRQVLVQVERTVTMITNCQKTKETNKKHLKNSTSNTSLLTSQFTFSDIQSRSLSASNMPFTAVYLTNIANSK